MPVPERIYELIERFKFNEESYRSGGYNETQLRREFLDPFFEELGWDVLNRQGYAEAYKDVIHEDAIKIGGGTKAPDYCFRIGGARKFFLEAKKPLVNIKDDISPAFQLRRYAWSAKLPLSVLSDFEEFAIYDCRIEPVKTDKAATARIFYCRYTDYADKWEEIAGIFSKQAILKGSFDKYAAGKNRKGTQEVDVAFLQEIEAWREALAKNFALRNPELNTRDLNFAVQRTIDRIVFLRICEARGIERHGQLQELLQSNQVYQDLGILFLRADDRYNSGLFHFRKDKHQLEMPDGFTLNLVLDNKPLKEIIRQLYYPDSPYEFSVLPADILGQIYEQFLGKVIRLTAGHQAKVEEKPEVRKAGGVYYTPTYIVDYIVKQSVGKLCEDKSPKEVASLRILDPACGSGSFLLGAYQFLLDWHRDWYTQNEPEKLARGKNPPVVQTTSGDWRLTASERKRILLNNFYGVDIDPQAVETTRLSLLLKVLEGETAETVGQNRRLFQERALPDLANNIKCGNSLIGSDFYDGQQISFLDEEERYRINIFDWATEFSAIMKMGGFDAVIGNPPYGFHQIHADYVKPYLKAHFQAAQGSFEHYFLFYEKSLSLLKSNGWHGFIVPVTWLTIPSARSLRRLVLENYRINQICWLPERVFANAQVNTLVSVIQRSKAGDVEIKIYDSLGFKSPPFEERICQQASFIQSDYSIGIFERDADTQVIEKIVSASRALHEFARPCSGYNPYEVGTGLAPDGKPQTKETVEAKPYHSTEKLGEEWKPEMVGRDLGRYSLKITGSRWIKYGPWLAAPRDPDNFIGKRILVQEITGGKERRIIATYYEGELYHSRDVIPIKLEEKTPNPFYLLGFINSKLMTWYHHKRNPKAQKSLFPKVLVSDLKSLPIRVINFNDSADRARHDLMVGLVEQMLALHRQLSSAKTNQEQTVLQRQIDATDGQIDQLVYELYGLSEEEIAIVESAAVSV